MKRYIVAETEISTLDKPFKHNHFFKGSNLTRKQALEYFAAHYGDFSLKVDKVYNDIADDDYTIKCRLIDYNSGYSFEINEDELDYLTIRRQFYKNFLQNNGKLKDVPEYADFLKALKNK